MAEFEARRGPLEGLKQIADDPDYLAEWQQRSDAKSEPSAGGREEGRASAEHPAQTESIRLDVVLPDQPTLALESNADGVAFEHAEQSADVDGTEPANAPIPVVVPIVISKPTVLKMSESVSERR